MGGYGGLLDVRRPLGLGASVMKTFKKHLYPADGWITDDQDGHAHNQCSRCGLKVKLSRTNTLKFWHGGKWVSKRPACQVSEHKG